MWAILTTLFVAVVLGIVVFLIFSITQRATRRAVGQFETRFQAAQQIINHGQIPDEWIATERDRIAGLKRQGADPRAIDRVGRRAKAKTVKRLQQLYDFLEQGSYYDSVDSKMVVLETLQERQRSWEAADWQTLLTSQPSAPPPNRDADDGENDDGWPGPGT